MDGGLIESAAQVDAPDDRRYYGVCAATVVDHLDSTVQGRVKVRLPWLPGYEPWARVAAPFAGSDRGIYFIPQTGDEVLVAFEHGDVRAPFVIGSLWNGRDQPPVNNTSDATDLRVIRTPAGHEIRLNDSQQSIEITNASGQKITLASDKIELNAGSGAATLTLETSGKITLQATVSVEIKAAQVSVQGTTVEVKGSASATLDGGGQCTVQAGIVRIN